MPHKYHNLCLGALAWAVAALVFVLAPSTGAAKSVQLAWDPSSDPDVVGYAILYGTTSHNYTKSIDAGRSTSGTLPSLSTGATYYIAVTAYNSDNIQSTPSNEVSFTVPANVPPTVSLTNPQPGASLNGLLPISLGATASDPDGSVVKVEFYQGTTLIGQSTSTPFNAVWNNAASGNYQLTALAYDDSGAAVRSAAVPVTVIGAGMAPIPSATPPLKMHIVALTPMVRAGGTAKFKVVASRNDSSQATLVSYSVSGTAVSGVDYDTSGLSGQISIPAGARSAFLQFNTMDTNSPIKRKTVSISLLAGTAYRLGASGASVVIVDRTQ